MTDEIDAEVVSETGVAAPPWAHEITPEVATVADFSRREFALRELMDEPCTFEQYRAAALSLGQVHRWARGYKPTLEFLGRVLERTGVGHEPLHVVDVGCGHGDGLRKIYRWAAKRSVPLRLTGVDVNPYAARLARECDRKEHVSAGTIAWVTGDVFAMELDRPMDVVVSSLLAHHLCDEAIVRLLRWKDDAARVGWFVNDLRRSERAAMMFGWMGKVLPMEEMVKRDGVVSFRRALSVEEWGQRCVEAGVDAEVRDLGMGRVGVERLK